MMACMFLHRYAGHPDQGSLAGFSDVSRNSYYAAAVDFLVAQLITTGTSPSTFSPDSPVTRGQLVAFLWRFAEEPEV